MDEYTLLHGDCLTEMAAMDAENERLSVQRGDLVRCEGCGSVWDAVDASSEGWHRTDDDCDLCPECWAGFVAERITP